MKVELQWLDDPKVFRVNQLPAHSDHSYYDSREAYQTAGNYLLQSLNGSWKFKYSANAEERPINFFEEEFSTEEFDEIAVPGHIELAGYDKIHYINTMYPWEGHVYRRPAYSLGREDLGIGLFHKDKQNPVGSYVKTFDLNKELLNKQVYISFEGVEQAMYIWLNGTFIGYAEDSFTPSEFDLTPYLHEKNNVLAVEVYKRSKAAYLEDQDFFRFFGIFRKVTLCAKPDVHLEDMWARPVLEENNEEGKLQLDLRISYLINPGTVKIFLLDEAGNCCMEKKLPIREQMSMEHKLTEKVIPWNNKRPYLYTLLIELYDKEGVLREIVPYKIGFRRIEIRNKVMYLNGSRLILNGVNRHEWSATTGRCISLDEMQADMDIIKKNHINAVRTSHYPNQLPWYGLCDEHGIYTMAEVNLESHGSWQKKGAIEPSWNVPGSIPQWRDIVMDRARTNFELLKNHTSILFWSLGNESFAGDNIAQMNHFYKEKDNSRLVHYEGVFHNRSYENIVSDVESRMYASPGDVRDYLENEPKKPFILCEFMHDMGNSLGGLNSYMKLLHEYEMYQGGFIWDFMDQALWVKDEITGQQVLRYGGDFADRPSDYEFSGNGIVFADRTEKPAMQEVKYYYGLYE